LFYFLQLPLNNYTTVIKYILSSEKRVKLAHKTLFSLSDIFAAALLARFHPKKDPEC